MGVLQRKTFSLSTGTHIGGRAFGTVSFEIEKACYVNLAPVTSADKRTSKTASTQTEETLRDTSTKCSDIYP